MSTSIKKKLARMGLVAGMAAAAVLLPLAMVNESSAMVRVCGERVKMTKMLSGKYQEKPKAIGVSATGKSVLEVFTSSEGSWTLLMTTAKGMTCIMGAGHSWQDQDQTKFLPKT